jgi:hypothetical protein
VFPPSLCLGSKEFKKQLTCKTLSRISKMVTVLFSLFLDSFGFDRFYLGYFWVGIIKLLTLRGFDIWSLIDFFLLLNGVIRPEDGTDFHDPSSF